MRLKIAVQKSGHLHAGSMELLNRCGAEVQNGNEQLLGIAQNFPLEVYFLPDEDIPQYVQDGVADIGIVGENTVYEKSKEVEVVETLGFGKCRLSIAVPRNEEYTSHYLKGKRIATRYPFLCRQYLKKNGIDAAIHEISSSVELAPGIGLADAICDLVGSGSNLLIKGLKEVETVLEGEAALIKNLSLDSEQLDLLNRLLFRISAVRAAKNNKYVLLNAPDETLPQIFKLLQGLKSPTVLPLAERGWSSVHTIINENEFWDRVEALKNAGAQGIVVMPVEKMIV